MVLHRKRSYRSGLNVLVEDAENTDGTRLDFGIISLNEGDVWQDAAPRERAVLLISGDVSFEWSGHRKESRRISCFDENPEVLHVPAGTEICVRTLGGKAELAYEACMNNKAFEPVFYSKNDVRNDVFGEGTLGEAATRTVRTVFDGENADFSNMVLGEVINHPGRWSSYPPHDHPHPEIYHYKLFPEQGFGISILEEEAHLVRDGSTSLIHPNTTHSQVAAAGYAMFYLWMIPHLPGDRWLPSTRYFREEHKWLLEKEAEIWPKKPYKENS